MTKTQDNLNAAFAGKSQANRKYLAFAKQAEAESYPQVAKLFRAAAAAETVHALSHLRTLGDVKTTVENLQVAISGENYEYVSMYPDFIAEPEAAGEKKALGSFHRAMEVKKSTRRFIKPPSKTWAQTRATWITTSARSAVRPITARRRRNAPSAGPLAASSSEFPDLLQ